MKLLAAIDFSELTEPVLRETERLARGLSAEAVLLHVRPPVSSAFDLYPETELIPLPAGGEALPDGTDGSGKDRIEAMAEALRQSGIRATALGVDGDEVERIVGEAQRIGAGMIIVGSHGHGALFHLLVGSVSEGVVRKATCPVLIVPRQTPG
ncbi:universal stress protein [Chlorobium sp. N1]|uniref:universal stress protein n=1 Tax=Chlorobium sp. N1 TaxID=2491138 RepID=UPI00103F921E|nr:universal stress protein [Chlorobium sp. N1]TCD47724.1 universal stress protein [Chlorobium sp. N1]